MSANVPHGAPSRDRSTWAIGLAIAALVVSSGLAVLMAVMVLGTGSTTHGWFAYDTQVQMRDMEPLLNDGSVAVDAEGGVLGEVIAGALRRALDPTFGPLTCQAVRPVAADATSVCNHENLPGEKVVVLFMNDRGRFVWSQMPVDASAYLPQD
ncbi:hypothetical protein ACOCJ4_06980 [Knoellia sp. CPCC 206435]|uniref:hypothetical protein n=1 Tax=Knoellia terrae TaxID=3404797 RepID=UPI003B42EA36